MKNYALAFSLSILVACGGDGQSVPGLGTGIPTPDSELGGIWEGAITEPDSSTLRFSLLIDEESEAVLYIPSTPEMERCTMDVSANRFSCEFSADYTITGTVVDRTSITGEITKNTDESTFTANYNNLYDGDSLLTKTAQIWQRNDGAYTETYTIDSDGDMTGSDTDGCNYLGSITIIDGSYNMYNYTQTISDCGVLNGIYSGKAYLSQTTLTEDTLNVFLIGDNSDIADVLIRQ